MRNENEFDSVIKSKKKRKKVRAFVPGMEMQIRPIAVDSPSPLDDFFEMPPPADEPPPEPEKEEGCLAFVAQICEENGFPFVPGRRVPAVGGVQPDLICPERRVVIEVHDPRRTPLELNARVRAFHHHGYRTQLITAGDLMRKDARERCTRIVRSLLR